MPLHCRYFEAGECRSCALIETPYADQLAAKEARCRSLLPAVPDRAWLPAFPSPERDFRNRVKLVVGGAPGPGGRITLGILGPSGEGVDLRECLIQAPEIAAVVPAIAGFLEETGLPPYSVPERRGELKFVHVTVSPGGEPVTEAVPMHGDASATGVSPSGELMIRFVVRTQRSLDVLRSRLDRLRELVPDAVVISVNLLPEHKAVLEGEREELLLGSSLPMRLGTADRPLALHLRPQSFFQTNTAVARELYAQAASWVAAADPRSVWDLYCGVGGFALHVALGSGGADREVIGVELSGAAVDSARRSAREAGLRASFIAADATEFALSSSPADRPELLIVNPPRRGIGARLAEWIEGSAIRRVVYSSCNPESLARDLAAMPAYGVRAARVFDMFPHTSHMEVAVLLERST